MKKLLLLPLLPLMLFLGACNPMVLTEADNGTTVTLKKGDLLVVQLRGNVSTGNKWRTTFPQNDIIQEAKPSEYKPDNDKIGSPGTYSFYFVATEKGKGVLRMMYSPLNGDTTKQVKTFEVNMVVK